MSHAEKRNMQHSKAGNGPWNKTIAFVEETDCGLYLLHAFTIKS